MEVSRIALAQGRNFHAGLLTNVLTRVRICTQDGAEVVAEAEGEAEGEDAAEAEADSGIACRKVRPMKWRVQRGIAQCNTSCIRGRGRGRGGNKFQKLAHES